jgi:branched-chain amino acid transport system ATP-binding protein
MNAEPTPRARATPGRRAGENDDAQAGRDQAAALSVEGLSLSFGGIRALRDVSFDVAPGTITALIGPNGAGKTSMFNCISGFYRPSTGRIVMDGRALGRVHAPERAKLGFARTCQNIALFRGMTVLDNIKLGRHAHLKTNIP